MPANAAAKRKKASFREVYATLKSLGTAQNIKIYTRHGAPETMFGVSFANLHKLRKQIKQDHAIALKLWETGNMDAMILATLIIDPEQVTEELLDAWVTDLDYFMTADYFVNGALVPTPYAKQKVREWTKSKGDLVRRAGYSALTTLAKREQDTFTDKQFETFLKRIEREIHGSPNRSREAMNSALIAIGRRNPHLHTVALAAAERIGKVEIDHGKDTHCKDVDAVERLTAHSF